MRINKKEARPAGTHRLKPSQVRIPLSQQVLAGLDLNGPKSTANAIDRDCPACGTAILQGTVVRRRVEIDLTDMLGNRSPVRIHR